MTNSVYQTAPHLVCLERTDSALRLCHFGNLFLYNTFNPSLTIDILRTLQNNPETVSDLKLRMSGYEGSEVEIELERLRENFYVYSTDVKGASKEPALTESLRFFVRNNEELASVSQAVAQARVGVIDFCGLATNLIADLKSFGFTHVQHCQRPEILDAKFVSQQNFFFVIGETQNKLEFSRINQALVAQNKRWLLVTTDMFGGMIGPAFGLAGGPCYDCILDHSKRHYDKRYRSSDYVDLIAGASREKKQDLPLARNLLNMAVIESVKIISKMIRPMSFEGFYSFDFFNFRMDYSHVSPSPTCPVCSVYAREKR